MGNLPDFDEMVKMAKEDPERLETLRKEMVQEIIEAAPTEDQKRKLRGLQFRIDMERTKAKTPLASCIKISSMMRESFVKLKDEIQKLQETNPNKVKDKKEEIITPSSTVIDFKRKE